MVEQLMKVAEFKKFYESKEFNEKNLYEGTDLGVICQEDKTTFKLWSPVSDRVTLNLYEDGECSACRRVEMRQGEKGTWEYVAEGNCHGVYYDYTIECDGEVCQSADPWAKACNCNGGRSMAVDLKKTNPEGWELDHAPERTTEQVVYEMHVKDFSYDPASGVPKEFRGKYKAFTIEGTTLNGEGKLPTCLDYLKELGVTHVQLMPVYDFGSVDEGGDEKEYNWGYDPWNYNVPEGSYSTDPFHGEVRIKELKEAIMALHKNGIRVIMDVVYNHTYQIDSWFTRVVPHYFYRQFEDGTYSDGSACGNDVASEREMCGKYILESVLYWAEEYHIDGFRFDLMGLLDVNLMNRIREELDLKFGKGEILVYGEPWSADVTAMKDGHTQCFKNSVHLLDEQVGMFCDNTRDAIKGHVFYDEVPGFVNGGKDLEQELLHAAKAWVGADEDFQVKSPAQIISYISAHDNLTLWDKLMITMKQDESFLDKDPEVIRANKMAAAIYFTCQGRIFFLGGEEAARTKQGDSNSFVSSIEINQIDWNRTYEYEEVLSYYKGLIAFRKIMPGLYDKSANAAKRIFDEEIPKEGVVQFSVDNSGNSPWDVLKVVYNSTQKEQKLNLAEDNWELLVDGESSWLWKQPKKVMREQIVAPMSVAVMGRRK